MEYRVAICDDEAQARVYIGSLVSQWAESHGYDIITSEYESAEAFLFSGYEAADILLLDIEMGGKSGVELAKELRRRSCQVQIIFITGYSDYIAEGYEVAALHYLMKPVNREKLFTTLDRAVEHIVRDEQMLVLETIEAVVRIPCSSIRYIDVQGNYITVHAEADYTARKTLNDIAAQLDERFYRLGRSCIVNLSSIRRVSRSAVTLSDGTELPLPRGAYDGINRAIINMK